MVFKKKFIFTLIFVVFLSVLPVAPVFAAKLFLSPSGGTFTVGSTFNVNIFLDTEGESVNTVKAILDFPADKMQLISPSVGQSIISVWTAQPIFNNQTGSIRLTGGIPNGVNVQSGLVTSLTFRVKQIASPALVRFSDESRVLANDGSGTDVLQNVQSGIYNFILPPPQGPIVSSQTHPDQSKWYASKDVVLNWASVSLVEEYSYVLDQNPAGVPDNISEGSNVVVTYNDLSDGTHYFHIKSFRNGTWGGISTFGISIDSEAPAEFSPRFIPSGRTSSKDQIVNFQTSDTLSGVSYYELKVVSLSLPKDPKSSNGSSTDLFIEATSPYQMALGVGKYDVILRAYDNAGNYREVTKRLRVVTPLFEIVSEQGIRVGNLFIIKWLWFWIMMPLMIGTLLIIAWWVVKWRKNLKSWHESKELPVDVKRKLDALKEYRKKYGSLVLLVLLAGSLAFPHNIKAEQASQIQLSVPVISSVSRNISNDEIFYVGGQVNEPQAEILIYLQNLQTGETFSQTAVSDEKGDWFYRHSSFLSPGDYLLWTQGRSGDLLSPPSSQEKMTVQKTAIQFGSSRFSYETLYFVIAAAFLLMILILVLFIFYHAYHGRKKHKLFWKEVAEAEESIRRGFAVLKRDIESEISTMRKIGKSEEISRQLAQKEAILLKDLDEVQKHITKEIWDIEQTEHLG